MSKILLRKFAVAVFATASAMVLSNAAVASQGPGVIPGTASASLQLAMAIIVYGGSALLVAVGAIGAFRHR